MARGDGQNARMALKLFRSTGYSSILAPGETRQALHPAWMAVAVSLWTGFVCNVAVWRGLRGSASLSHGLASGAAVASASLLVLSVLGWRKTLKPAATVVLVLAALGSATIWAQAWPVDRSLLARPASAIFVPAWPDLLRWQFSATLVALALAPAIWVWQTSLRRLRGPQQLRVNLLGVVVALALFLASAWLLERGA